MKKLLMDSEIYICIYLPISAQVHEIRCPCVLTLPLLSPIPILLCVLHITSVWSSHSLIQSSWSWCIPPSVVKTSQSFSLLFQWGLGQTVIAIVIVFILIIWILRKRDQNVHNVNILTIPILTQSTTVRQQSESKPDSLTLMVAMALITHLSLLARWGNNGWCFTVTCKSWMPSEVRVKRVTTTTEGK